MEGIEDESSKPFPANEPEHELYTIPSYSSWFSWDDIHETEKIYLKEFFDGSSISRTPKIYKEYRDFIINKYREEPSRNLTFTEIRKSLIGDVCLIRKVFLFLEKWGLINFGASSPSPDNLTVVNEDEERQKVRFEEGAPNGIRVVSIPNSSKAVSFPPNVSDVGEAVENGFRLPPLASYTDVFGDLIRQKRSVSGNRGEDCVTSCNESYKQESLLTSVKHFKNENYEERKSVDDYELKDCKDNSNKHGDDFWTDAETLLLLESVLKHGDDWDLVAQNVQTKNRFECISRLIQLPFGELMLGAANGKGDSRNSNSNTSNAKQLQSTPVGSQELIQKEDQNHEHTNETEQIGDGGTEDPPLKRRCIASFADAGSSLMKQVALLSTAVSPHVAAAAAEAAVTVLCDESPGARMVFEGEEDNSINIFGSPAMNNEPKSVLNVEELEMGERHTQSETQDAIPENSYSQTLRIRTAVATALGAAAAHAKLLADQEDREIEHLVANVIETQLRKIHCKIKHFEELELIMEKEYAQIQELKESIISERIDALQWAFKAGISRWRDHTPLKSFMDSVFRLEV